ncbi:PREDICTED: uncharacterized protein LOC108660469 [Theobroma cacao]|uniref:Uncharacterized protein LOC108660469 n=1 Tax=Theobroma cacao TaxID=3641 RepID=A0AB32W7A9_THECC|nr:PREDICTED: uncharacterized protein LOC108660469 [Theobroma cacao]
MSESENFGHEHPLVLNEGQSNQSEEAYCSRCEEEVSLSAPSFSCVECGFYLHKKCAEAPLEINHPLHPKHPLLLQHSPYADGVGCICDFCDEICKTFIYHCSCGLDFHITCALLTFSIAEKFSEELQHVAVEDPFISTKNDGEERESFNCFGWHHHRIFHTYFLHDEDFKSWDCIICHHEVNTEHGSYYCSNCKIIVQVNCAIKKERWYYIVSQENEDGKSIDSLALLPGVSIDSITCVIERNDAGEATKIKHFKHVHDLMLSEKIAKYDKSCDGCMLPISASFYYCSECDFFLHKTCAE